MTDRRDVVVIGGGHNGLVAAVYLARAGLSVLVLERGASPGGAAVSSRPFPGVDVRLSRYSYLVSLLPRRIVADLGLPITLRRRAVPGYPPVPRTRFAAMTARVAQRLFPTLTEPLPDRRRVRELIDDEAACRALFDEPLNVALERFFADDTARGTVLTDGLIGTFAPADDPLLRPNRCLVYHVIGNGTGDWDVPVGGMGAVTAALVDAARRAGAELVTGAEVRSVDPDGRVGYLRADTEHAVAAGRVLANVAPAVLAGLLGEAPPEPAPEGAQLKVNMVLRRLPRPRAEADPDRAFRGTFHVHEGYRALARAYAQAAGGTIPAVPPCEIYCHSLTDPSILGPAERAAGVHTLTLFGLHMPARLFAVDHDGARADALAATLAALNSVLAEPIEDCLLADANGNPCVEAKTPLDLERELGLPGGHIFHRDLSWPWAPTEADVGNWGVATAHERVLLCGAGAIRGGGVSGIPGHNAAMAVLEQRDRLGRRG